MTNKSTQVAYILRVSGYDQIALLRDAFGGKRRAQINDILAGYQRYIQPHGFNRHGAYATVVVRTVAREDVETTVYSMETSTGTLITSSGLISHNCFPKDVKALAHMADEAGLHPQLLDAVMKINHDQRHVVIDKLAAELGGLESLRGKRIGVLGLAFKDNTDDMRDAPALDIVTWLVEAGALVRVYDPVAMETAKHLHPGWRVRYCADEYDCAAGCDGVVVVTEWKQFRRLNFSRLRDAMKPGAGGPVLIDGRNLFEATEMQRIGFRYHGIGRGEARRNGNGNGNGHGDARHEARPADANGAKTRAAKPLPGMQQ